LRDPDVRVIDVIRGDAPVRSNLSELRLEAGDRVLMKTNVREVMSLREKGHMAGELNSGPVFERIATRASVVVEGIVGPRSAFLGRTLADIDFTRRYGAYVLAIHREDENFQENLDQLQLAYGDVLLLDGAPDGVKRLFDAGNLINLTEPQERPLRRNKAPIALLSVFSVMGFAAFNVLPIEALAIIAAAVVILTRCVDVEEAYKAIDLRILILIYGMLAFGAAMDKTGAAATVAEQITVFAAEFGPVVVLSVIYALTSILTEVVTNNAVAVLMTPIAIGVATSLGLDPRPFVVAVMFAASATFATPIGYQTNTFVYNAGGYRFVDFIKVGVPLNVFFGPPRRC
jgi:di/tricarboxylate transporter